MQTEIIRKRTKYHCSTSPRSIQGIIFSTGNGGTLLAISSKDNTRVELVEVEVDFYGLEPKDR